MRAKPILQTVEPRRTPALPPRLSPASLRTVASPVESQALLQGQRTVTISHNG
jgi:hemin uptake protein HemP